MRKIMERQGPVEFDGEIYQLPYRGPGASGLGKPLKSILEATPGIPIYCASFTPAGLAARGWDADMLQRYLATGVSPRAVASDEMLTVVNLSTSRLNDADRNAMATYLLGDHAPSPKTVAAAQVPQQQYGKQLGFEPVFEGRKSSIASESR